MAMDVGGSKGGVKSDINVTPLVDVMLVLLIIMMIVAPLLQKGADVNARITDVKSRTARMGRASSLQEQGGQRALFGAVQWAWPRVVQYLIDHGAERERLDAHLHKLQRANFILDQHKKNQPLPNTWHGLLK